VREHPSRLRNLEDRLDQGRHPSRMNQLLKPATAPTRDSGLEALDLA
jgi:hypothetical protein